MNRVSKIIEDKFDNEVEIKRLREENDRLHDFVDSLLRTDISKGLTKAELQIIKAVARKAAKPFSS